MRKFTDEELTQDQVVALLKAALMSPSSKRSNPWQFIVVDDKETLQKLSLCKEMGASFLKDAALAIVVMADPLTRDVCIEDAAIASLMIQLQAEGDISAAFSKATTWSCVSSSSVNLRMLRLFFIKSLNCFIWFSV